MLRLPLSCSKPWQAKRYFVPHQVKLKAYKHCPSRRGYATVTDLGDIPKPGEQIHGFTLKRAKNVPELQLTALHLEHDKTGAEYLHIARNDQNNVFSISFKTNPPNATGVPHILEHTTLCGSHMYPVRDPFFKMLPRSLSNFMNAFTSPDHTTYPFATTNRADFKNLMSVYLDSTLHPLLKEEDFSQEGWRIGPQNPKVAEDRQTLDSEDAKLVFKGVVYNEMKGQMSDASYLYHILFQSHIFPDINNSGGDPQKMTDLTYQELKDYHARNYHPSNSKIFTYGNMPVAEHLLEINEQFIKFERSARDEAIKTPLDLSAGPLFRTVKGPFDPLVDEKAQYKTSTSWLMGDTSNVLETFSLGVISSVLLDGYGSPMYQSLIEENGLGSDFSVNTGFDSGAKRGIFSIGLNGVKEDDVPKVKKAIQAKLREIYDQGIDERKVDGILHQLEVALKHRTADFGVGLMQRLGPGWFNGVDPLKALAWNDTIEAFKNKMADSRYLEDLVKRYLLNDRTLTFTMEPSPTYGNDVKVEENLRLETKISEVAQNDGGDVHAAYQKLANRELQLFEAQSSASNENTSCLPSLHIQDIPRQMEKKMIRTASMGPVKVQWRETRTNGLTYFRAVNHFDHLPTNLRMLLPLFTAAIMRLGTREKSIEQLEDDIKFKTGGLNISYHSTPSPTDMNLSHEGICLSSFALDGNVTAMLDLFLDIIMRSDFDSLTAESQIRQLLQQDASGALDAVANSGHIYASRYAQAGMTAQGLHDEQTSGFTQLQQVTHLASLSLNEGLLDVIEKLKLIQQFAISNFRSLRVAITCGFDAASANRAALEEFFTKIPEKVFIPKPRSIPSSDDYARKSFFPLPYQVYYAALSLPTVSYTDPAGGPLQILSQLLTHKHLHHEIREKGGAYGGGASARALGGMFNYYSYRDPNPQNSLKVMQNAGRWAADRDWSPQDIEEAKLSTFQSVDAPTSVSEDGMMRFLSGVTEEMEQQRREILLDVKKEDIQGMAQRFLVDGMKDARVALLGETNDWIKNDEGWLIRDIELSKP